ncbi:MAG: excinuclease ABC subunit UvrC [Candidatus Gracilibacteria bacterium]|nr:excinuclease ABC subunit UvrC [Candidatus Gracilibacteria bacterium]
MIEERKLKQILKNLSASPGVYKMTDEEGKVIYIGKAKNLKNRIRQYFQKNYQHSTRTKKLLEKISNLECIVVDSELEAIILESNLIKQFLPKYNVIMKDDKNYVYIRIGKEDFPRITIVRKVENDGAKYIGPKTASNKVQETFKVLKKIFPFRTCGLNIEFINEKKDKDSEVKISNKVIKYPCLDYHIKQCLAPCIGKCRISEYKEIIENVGKFLQGKADNILKSLSNQMMDAAKNKDFEKAAKIRDKISKVNQILEKQKMSNPNQEDKDIINYIIARDNAYFNLFQIRDGKLIGQENFILSAKEIEDSSIDKEVLESFLSQYYSIATDIPKEILIPHEPENTSEIKTFIENSANRKISLIIPKIGTKNHLLEMSLNNAKIYADRNKPTWQEDNYSGEKVLKDIQKITKSKNIPNRIECYDISHLGGTDTVGSMIVFEKGLPKNNMYRRFKIRTVVNKPDDYKSLEEVLTRRLSKITEKLNTKEYIFKKAQEKYKKLIEKTIKKEELREGIDYKNFFILEKNKKTLAGFAALTQHSKKSSEINSFCIMPKERGNKIGLKLLKNIINKSKTKRIYIICKESLRDYYLSIGFEEVKKFPEDLLHSHDMCIACDPYNKPLIMVYDKQKHPNDESFEKIPDLIIIDGGKGQLKTSLKVMQSLKINIPCIALAKKLEEIFVQWQANSIILQKNNESLKLLQRARDEAHRFAITYNKDLRAKRLRPSAQ